MKLKLSGAGLEPKKIAMLAALLLVLIYFLWPSSHGDQGAASSARASRAVAPPLVEQYPGAAPETRSVANTRRDADKTVEEFRPSLRKIRLANTDPSHIDPTLRLDLLAKLQSVKVEDGMRSLFEASEGPVKEPAPVLPKGPVKKMPDVADNQPPPGPPPPPPPPPIPLKFYGFVNPGNIADRRAFFLEGEDILVAREGETVAKRYKIIRIGVNSAVVEDTQFSNQQTLPLMAEAQAAG